MFLFNDDVGAKRANVSFEGGKMRDGVLVVYVLPLLLVSAGTPTMKDIT